MRILAGPIVVAVLFAGCSNHPLQDDVTGYTSHQIVEKLRCEAQRAVLDQLAGKKLGFLQDRIFALSREHKIYGEWRANNNTLLSEFEKEIDAHDAKVKRSNEKTASLKSAVSELSAEGRALKLKIAEGVDQATRQRLEARLEVLNERAAILLSKVKAAEEEQLKLVGDGKTIAGEGKDIEARYAARFGSLGTTPALYLKKRKKFDERAKALKSSPDIDPALLGDEFSDRHLGLYRELFAINRSTLSLKLDFKITENNNAVADGSLTWPIHLGSLSLLYKAGKEKGRIAQRIIQVTSTFEELSDRDDLRCVDHAREAYGKRVRTYPIVGNIGVDELIKQYFEILEAATIVVATGQDTFTDILQFTTKISGKINPTIEVRPVSPSLIKGGFDLNADRTDLHQVTVQVRPYSAPALSSDPKLQITKIPNLTVNIGEGADGHGTIIGVQ